MAGLGPAMSTQRALRGRAGSSPGHDGRGEDGGPYTTSTFAARAISPHFFRSASMKANCAAGVIACVPAPISASRATYSASSATVLIAALSFATTSGGVAFGAM